MLPITLGLLQPSLFVALLALLLLLGCREKRWYFRLWCNVCVGSVVFCLLCWGLYSSSPSGRTPSRGDPIATELLIAAFQCLVLFPAFPVLIISALLPPTNMPHKSRAILAGGAVALAIALGSSIYAKNSAYVANFQKAREAADAKANQRAEVPCQRVAPVAPDPQLGPRTEAEWLYLGATPYGSSSDWRNMTLEGLWFKGTPPAGATAALRHVKRLQRLTLQGKWVTDADLENVTHLIGLHDLRLINTSITDQGLRRTAAMPHLKELTLTRNDITDVSLVTLLDYARFLKVCAYRNHMTNDGWHRFKARYSNDPRFFEKEWYIDSEKFVRPRPKPEFIH
jgi:hypothetical protein